jgi:hypothetical protein
MGVLVAAGVPGIEGCVDEVRTATASSVARFLRAATAMKQRTVFSRQRRSRIRVWRRLVLPEATTSGDWKRWRLRWSSVCSKSCEKRRGKGIIQRARVREEEETKGCLPEPKSSKNRSRYGGSGEEIEQPGGSRSRGEGRRKERGCRAL